MTAVISGYSIFDYNVGYKLKNKFIKFLIFMYNDIMTSERSFLSFVTTICFRSAQRQIRGSSVINYFN